VKNWPGEAASDSQWVGMWWDPLVALKRDQLYR
jgi:hypothetical protein